jgi:hypothetical protein
MQVFPPLAPSEPETLRLLVSIAQQHSIAGTVLNHESQTLPKFADHNVQIAIALGSTMQACPNAKGGCMRWTEEAYGKQS